TRVPYRTARAVAPPRSSTSRAPGARVARRVRPAPRYPRCPTLAAPASVRGGAAEHERGLGGVASVPAQARTGSATGVELSDGGGGVRTHASGIHAVPAGHAGHRPVIFGGVANHAAGAARTVRREGQSSLQ